MLGGRCVSNAAVGGWAYLQTAPFLQQCLVESLRLEELNSIGSYLQNRNALGKRQFFLTSPPQRGKQEESKHLNREALRYEAVSISTESATCRASGLP